MATADRDDIVATLNDLIETARDGEQGFRTCADNAKAPDLKTLFQDGARRCAAAIVELQRVVQLYGGTPETSGTVAGALHRGWVDLRSIISKSDDLAILEECERGEDHAVSVYRKALQQELPADVRALVERMYEGTVRNHEAIRQLRDAKRQTAS